MTPLDRQKLQDTFGARLRFDEPLSRHTSFRIGGPADVWVEVQNPSEIGLVQKIGVAASLPIFVLGGGTNLLVSDRGVRGIVVHLGRPFQQLEWWQNGNGQHVRAGAAVPFKKVVTESIHRELTGLEFAEGIPGSVGGGLLMNAGAFGGEISRVVTSVEGVDACGQQRRLPRSELHFEYRFFDLQAGFVVTHLELLLQPGDHAAIVAKRDDAKRRREKHQPLGYPNAGSVFKNPPGHFAGRLIESAGCKGQRRGGAMVSAQHANFIVNADNAMAADVRGLMDDVVRRVFEIHGVTLEPEIRLVGDWSPT
ncbi:MAG: UDP-N-acetylmuramate dehydrogenase [Deltaproteobacteria bacterium]|nr:UDP-N-acetylmuramate dehydrogenase [Deltaproteobacteria bacterium]